MRVKLAFCVMCIMLFSCESSTVKPKSNVPKNSVNKVELMASIQSIKDSLFTFEKVFNDSARSMEKEVRIALETNISVARQEFINRNVTYYTSFPKDSLSVHCLMNIYHLYDKIQAYEKAISYMDTIEVNYPDFPLPIGLLFQKAVNLDLFIEPRDTSRIRKCYERVLNYPDLPAKWKSESEYRLRNLDENIEDIIP